MTTDKIQQMREWVEQLNQAADAYYNGQGELLTDYEWDAHFDQLKRLEEETGVVLPDSPTNKVSADNISGAKEAHEFPALSLAKTKQPIDLAKWAEGRPIWMSWKLDGLTLVVTFDAGRLTKVVTRGNGHIGTNITHLANAIQGIPQTIPYQGHAVVRGECVISYADFEQFNMESDEEYANPRNLASGSLTLKDVDEVRSRHLQWIPFTLVHTDNEIRSWGARMEWLRQNGMHPVAHEEILNPTLQNIEQTIAHWTEQVTQKINPYPVDGLVITYDDTQYAQTGSVTGHHATRAGYAFKWQDEHADTTLDHVEWSCAASTISPVAIFSPVELEGTTVKRASLCNISECERLGMGGQGTKLRVIKANKIIPKVIEVIETVGTLQVPCTCPVCQSPTQISVSEVSNTKTLHCTNKDCPAKQLKKFARFVSKEGVNIEGMSEQTVVKFMNLGWIKTYADLFLLKDYAEAMAQLDGFGLRSTQKLLASIERARNVDAQHFLFALSIPLCGQDVCRRLLQAYPLTDLMAIARQPNAEPDHSPLAEITGIGPEKSSQFERWFRDEEHFNIVTRLMQLLHISQPPVTQQGNRCAGLTFVITGDVVHYKNRNALQAYIESQGGKVTGSVSKSTHYLINNDATSTSAKNQKAHQLAIPIITEDEFMAKFTAADEHDDNVSASLQYSK